MTSTGRLLASDEAPPVRVLNPAGASPFLILGDHAGRRVPRGLLGLGVPPAEMDRHIAWDIGIEPVCRALAQALDATVIMQEYSRLVIDCNRAPGHATSIPAVSDGTRIAGNAHLPADDAARRVQEIFAPYHAAIATELDRRQAVGHTCIVIAMHSFTPVMGGVPRPWEAGILHDRTPEFGLAVGDLLRQAGFKVGDNEPYRLTDESDYSVPTHAERRGLHYLELEIRQDLIAEPQGQVVWAAVLAGALPAAARRLHLL